MTRSAIKKKALLDAVVQRFNQRFPVGATLRLRRDSGWTTTRVRAPAEVLEGHTAVGWFEGVTGCYSIESDRIEQVCRLGADMAKAKDAAPAQNGHRENGTRAPDE
jgi:hypothetical protein